MNELDRLIAIMKRLRDPDTGCPWDREQTIDSIKGFTIEEAYEVVDAIERNNMEDLKDELGDLLFHVVFYSELADEKGNFDIQEVIAQVCEKLERRHPHVFSDMTLQSSDEVKALWEKTKREERQSIEKNKQSILDDISPHMPALMRAIKLQKRAASVDFDWQDIDSVIDKVQEELDELREAVTQNSNTAHIKEEMGDLLFCCINLARKLRIDPETTLRQTNDKFIYRFQYIEEQLIKNGLNLENATLEEMDRLWNQAKEVTSS
ncbi:MAG: nucleoside triphosphate pyrophosphohydrolase [Pseudomonadota bacterium]